MRTDLNSLSHSIACFIAGAHLISQPKLRRFVIIPLIVNFALLVWLVGCSGIIYQPR
jgi:Uncharacterized protein involved in cysteine biosynthesis